MARRRGRRRRRGFRGLSGRGGFMRGAVHALVPVAAGSVLTGGTTLALRAFVTPTPGTASETVYKWAPAIGMGAGLAGAALLYFLGGRTQGKNIAAIAAAASLFQGGIVLASERLNVARPGGLLALAGGGGAAESAGEGAAGLAALMPEYATPQGAGPLGAIVMEPVRGLGGPYGETVNVSGLGGGFRPSAFGRQPY